MRSVELHAMADKPVLWRAYVMPTGSDFTRAEHETNPSAVDITLQLSSAADAGTTVDFTLAFDGESGAGCERSYGGGRWAPGGSAVSSVCCCAASDAAPGVG